MSLLFVLGASELSVPKEKAAIATDLCAKLRILSDDHVFCENDFRFTVPIGMEKRMTTVLSQVGISYTLVKRTGLLSVLERYRYRYGLLVGALIFVFIVINASGVVWHIDITGNYILSEEEVLAALEESGLSQGVRLSDIDTDSIERKAIVIEKRLSWISVNMNGTSAYVEIRERIDADRPQRNLPYANIVSAEDAIIVDIETFSGMSVVKKGSYVRKGELLINGIISKEVLGTYPTYADGRVIGRIHKHFEIEFPYRDIVFEDSGRKLIDVTVDIFGKEILFSPFLAEFDNYNVASQEYMITDGTKRLPFSVTVNTTNEQIAHAVYRTPKQTQRMAMRYLVELLARDYPNAEIVEKNITVTEGERALMLCADITLDCEIGCVSEFDIDN